MSAPGSGAAGTAAGAGAGLPAGREGTRRFARFLATGGIAAAANLGSRMLFSLWLPYTTAIVLAWVVGVSCGYLLARRYVFGAGGQRPWRSAATFTAVNLFALLQTWAVSVGLAQHLLPAIGFDWHAQDLAHLAGVGAPVFTSYFAHRSWSFR
ncbi:GtrA family protein [Burkholderia gladioli]|jgi:putative flippase GtrA|uniref:GtrA family protein n=1 Tax=Burkholderia gladioli TaxID=28095 RepID=UPI00164122CE|nr:GtrA family protein [Burkholderia gladioli]MDN7603802.1 GtrA family protein [Burkholderia gladioli]